MENIPNIDPKKMALINEFKKMAEGKSSNEMLPLLLAVSKKSKSLGLKFSNEEMKIIIDVQQINSMKLIDKLYKSND